MTSTLILIACVAVLYGAYRVNASERQRAASERIDARLAKCRK